MLVQIQPPQRKPQQTAHKKSLGHTIFPSTNLAAHKHCGQSRDGAQLLGFGESRVPTETCNLAVGT